MLVINSPVPSTDVRGGAHSKLKLKHLDAVVVGTQLKIYAVNEEALSSERSRRFSLVYKQQNNIM